MGANITSRISTIRDSYGRFMDLFTEELNDSIAQELDRARAQVNEVVIQDENTLDSLLAQNHFRFSVADFENPQRTIRRAFLFRDQQFNRESERIQYFVGQWAISRDALNYLAEEMINLLQTVIAEFANFNTVDTADLSPQHQRQMRLTSFIHMTWGYHDFHGCAVNMQEVVVDYE